MSGPSKLGRRSGPLPKAEVAMLRTAPERWALDEPLPLTGLIRLARSQGTAAVLTAIDRLGVAGNLTLSDLEHLLWQEGRREIHAFRREFGRSV